MTADTQPETALAAIREQELIGQVRDLKRKLSSLTKVTEGVDTLFSLYNALAELLKIANDSRMAMGEDNTRLLDANAALTDALAASEQRRQVAEGALEGKDIQRLVSFSAGVYDYNRAGVVAFKLPNVSPSSMAALKGLFQALAESRKLVWITVNELAATAPADSESG